MNRRGFISSLTQGQMQAASAQWRKDHPDGPDLRDATEAVQAAFVELFAGFPGSPFYENTWIKL